MSFEYSQELINDYEKLLEIDKGHDVIIYVGEDENAKEIHAHSFILRNRSQYFRAAFSNEWVDKKDGKFIFSKPNISPQVFKIILRFIYCGKFDLTKLQGLELLDLLMAIDELSFQMLIPYIQECLTNNRYKFLQQSPVEILETVYQVYQHDTFKGLWDTFLEAICERPEILFNSDKVTKLRTPLLELFLISDNLLLDEIEIWDNLIKWSFAQHSSIQQNVEKWSEEEITIMKNIFHRFIPLIRFYHISSEDFHLKVYPFKVLLPENLINDILAFHKVLSKKLNNEMQHPRNPKYDTLIVKPQNFAIFSSWIEKKNKSYYNLRDIPHYFKLIYRASRDGNTAEEFHKKCDNKGATVVVVKFGGSDQIVGGYNLLDWDLSSSYKTTKDSFIYIFMDRSNKDTAKIGYSTGENSIGCFPGHGPIFGYYLYYQGVVSNTWIVNNTYTENYPNVSIPMSGSINEDDYEVFQVIKKV